MSIKNDVDRGLEIRAQLETLTTELKDIQMRLAHAALHGEQIELTDADREGRQYLAHGTTAIVPVILTADKLMGEFVANSPKHELVKLAARGKLLDFYKPANKFVNKFDNGKKFRATAAELLAEHAPSFITACIARDKDGIAKSDIKIMWDQHDAVPKQ